MKYILSKTTPCEEWFYNINIVVFELVTLTTVVTFCAFPGQGTQRMFEAAPSESVRATKFSFGERKTNMNNVERLP